MITLQLTEQEIQALAGLLDAGVKAVGLRAVKDAATLLSKLETAAQSVEEAITPKEETDNG
jgi:hypothetical protein